MSALIWGAWGIEWELDEKVSFDGEMREIHVHDHAGSLDIRSDLYSAWVRWSERESWALPAIRYAGLDPIPGGFTGDIYFLINGWKVIVNLSLVAVSGVLYSDDYTTAYYTDDMMPQYPATVSSLVNLAVTTQNVVTGDISSIPQAASPVDIATEVRTNLTPELNKINAQVDGLTASQQTMLIEMFKLFGLDPTVPLVVTDTVRQAGPTINQTIQSTANQTIVTRI